MPFPIALRRGAAYALALLGTAGAARAQAPLFIENPNASEHDGFGHAVDVDGDVAIIGAPSERLGGTWTGAAYVYRLQTDGSWALEATLAPVDYSEFDAVDFGSEVAISGDLAAVAAPGEWINHGSGDASTRGAVYVFRRQTDGTWAFEAEFNLPPFSNLLYAVGLDLDGDRVAVGASQWFVGPPGGGGGSGRQSAGSGIGTEASASSSCFDGGGVYDRARVDLYRYDGAAWALEAELAQPDSLLGITFATAVSLDSNVVAAGAPYYYSPEWCTGTDLDGDGTVEGEERGRVYVFREAGGTWAFEQALEPADLRNRDQLGHDVAVSGDRIVAGAPYRDGVSVRSGAAFSFAYDGAAWTEEAEFVGMDTIDGDYFGFAVDLQDDYAVVGAPRFRNGDLNLGATYGFQRVDGQWQEGFRVTYDVNLYAQNPVPINFGFGSDVALDASHVLIGAPEYGDYDGPEVAIDIGSAFSYTLAEYFGVASAPSVTLAARAQPTALPAAGGTVTFSVRVTNGEGNALPLDLWLEATGPASITRPLVSGVLPAGAAATRQIPVTVPASAPNGRYDVVLHLGRNGVTYATEAFTITKGVAADRGPGTADGLFAAAPQDWGAPLALASAAPAGVAAYPNPLSDRATLAFEIAEAAPVRLAVYDVLGREVARLVDGALEAGRHTATLDASALAAGTYVYRLTAGERTETGRLTVAR